MCHHFKIMDYTPAEVAEIFGVDINRYQLPLVGFYPLAQVPVIRMNDRDEREMVPMEWGLLPRWWKPSEKTGKRKAFQRKCFNARSETAYEKASYRDAFQQRRCLVPATDFMEKGQYFHLTSKRPFAFAGLWERWQNEQELVESCTILTTEPNMLVESVQHYRMPVLLTDETDYSLWLNPDIIEHEQLAKLFEPYDPQQMEIAP